MMPPISRTSSRATKANGRMKISPISSVMVSGASTARPAAANARSTRSNSGQEAIAMTTAQASAAMNGRRIHRPRSPSAAAKISRATRCPSAASWLNPKGGGRPGGSGPPAIAVHRAADRRAITRSAKSSAAEPPPAAAALATARAPAAARPAAALLLAAAVLPASVRRRRRRSRCAGSAPRERHRASVP